MPISEVVVLPDQTALIEVVGSSSLKKYPQVLEVEAKGSVSIATMQAYLSVALVGKQLAAAVERGRP